MKLINAINKVKLSEKVRKTSTNNIYLDATNQKIVATNGHALVALVPDEPIKESMLLSVPKLPGKAIELSQDSLKLTTEGGLTTSADKVDAVFPDWEQVVSDKEPIFSIGISLNLLVNAVQTLLDNADRTKANTIFRLDIVDANTPFKVSVLGDNSFGIIMPVKFE